MKRVEYRVEQLPHQEHPDQNIPVMLERLTELGKQGWHVTSVDLTYHPSYTPAWSASEATLPILLEREVEA
jgi:hypothetical protein